MIGYLSSLSPSLSCLFYSHYVCVCECVCHPGTQVVNVSPVEATSIPMASKFLCTWTGCSNSWTRLAGFLSSFNLLCLVYESVYVYVCVWVTVRVCVFVLTALLICATYLKFLPGSFVSRSQCKFAAWLDSKLAHITLALKSHKHSVHNVPCSRAFVSRALIASWRQTEPSLSLSARLSTCLCSLSTYNFRLNTQRTKRATHSPPPLSLLAILMLTPRFLTKSFCTQYKLIMWEFLT